jgi:hypothetical protein
MDPFKSLTVPKKALLVTALIGGAVFGAVFYYGRTVDGEWTSAGYTVLFLSAIFSIYFFVIYLTSVVSSLFDMMMPERDLPENILFYILFRDPQDEGESDEEKRDEAAQPVFEMPRPYDEIPPEPTEREAPAADEYRCPRCGSDDVIVQDEGPSPVNPGGVLPLVRLKALARRAGSTWGLRFCRSCGHRW